MSMEERSIVDLFPDLFEINSKDLNWYESKGFIRGKSISSYELDECATNYAKESIGDYQDYPDAVEECANRFKDGACWLITNYQIMQSLSSDEHDAAIGNASRLYVKEICEGTFQDPDDPWSENSVIDYSYVIETDFQYGIEWAEKYRGNFAGIMRA